MCSFCGCRFDTALISSPSSLFYLEQLASNFSQKSFAFPTIFGRPTISLSDRVWQSEGEHSVSSDNYDPSSSEVSDDDEETLEEQERHEHHTADHAAELAALQEEGQ